MYNNATDKTMPLGKLLFKEIMCNKVNGMNNNINVLVTPRENMNIVLGIIKT